MDIIRRLADIFDEITILVSISNDKKYMFTVEERKKLIAHELKNLKNIKVDSYLGLTVDYAKKNKIDVIIRGLRAVVDFEYEMTMANMNKKLNPEIETMLMFASAEYYCISSRGVKEIAQFKGKLDGLVPKNVAKALNQKIFN